MTSTDPVAPATSTGSPVPMVGDVPPAEGRRGRNSHVTSYAGGRVCSMAGCSTVLSVYNSSWSCSSHSIIGLARNPEPKKD